MKLSEAIKEMFSQAGLTYRNAAARMGAKSQGSVTNVVVRNNCSVSSLIEIANVCGYDLILQPKICGISKSQILLSDAGKKSSLEVSGK